MIPRRVNKRGHEKLKEFLVINHLEANLSEGAKKVLCENLVTLSEFLSFKHADFKKLRWSDIHIASELLAMSKKYDANGNKLQDVTNSSANKNIAQSRTKQGATIFSIPKHKHEMDELEDFYADDYLDRHLSVRAFNALKSNKISQLQFFSFSVSDFMALNDVGKATASELFSFAEQLRNMRIISKKDSQIINQKLTALNECIACAHDEKLSEILQPIQQTAYVETFNNIFKELKSIFEGNGTEKIRPLESCSTGYQYLFSTKKRNAFFICPKTEQVIPTHANLYERYWLNSREETILDYFDEAFYQSCILYIGHLPNDDAFIHRVIVETMDNLQKKYNIFSMLSFNSWKILYQLKFGEMPVFAIVGSYIDRLSDREKRMLHKSYVLNKSNEEIGIEEGLTRESVRQILYKTISRFQEWARKDGIMDVFKKYKFDELPYIIPENINFNDIKAKQALDYDFDIFCFIVSIMFDDVFYLFNRLKISQVQTNKVTYLCNQKLTCVIDLVRVQDFIQRNYSDPLNDEIALNPIVGKREFWLTDRVDESLINDVKNLLIYVCQQCFDLKVIDADIPFVDLSEYFVPAKIKSVIYEILSQNINPMSLEMIKKEMTRINHEAYESLTIDKLKSALSDKNLFTQIGLKDLYALATSVCYSGSVHQSIIKTLTEYAKPMKMEKLIQKVLFLRPDSNVRSVRAVVTNMIKNRECTLSDYSCVGLTSYSV